MKENVKKAIANGALSVAVVIGPIAAFIGISNKTPSELWIYTVMGTFGLSVFLHWIFRDENFDKLQAIKNTILILFTWLAILFFYAFMLGAYIAMFVSLGFFIVVYVIHLLIDVLGLESEKESVN